MFCWHHHSHSHHRPVHGTVLLKEESLYIRPLREYIFRANPGEEHALKLLVTKYGQPLRGAPVRLYPLKDFRESAPPDGVTVPNNGSETDRDGISTLVLKAHNVGQPRKNIDGQVYRYSYGVNHTDDDVTDETWEEVWNNNRYLCFHHVSHHRFAIVLWRNLQASRL